uniref:hypothetical protein n=1 Tax=Dyella soli TaxID=522319 RepID=UPI0013F3C1EF|nr:hypothetical protein [Dyella soli]
MSATDFVARHEGQGGLTSWEIRMFRVIGATVVYGLAIVGLVKVLKSVQWRATTPNGRG